LKKIKARWVAQNVLGRGLHPKHFLRYLKLSKKKQSNDRHEFDAQLKLYAQILPGDFLHYGYFDQPDVPPERISLHDIQQAQLRYAHLILRQLENRDNEVLDVGCGTGGLINLLIQNGFKVTGLTPDRFQIQYISEKYPPAQLIRAKFQNIDIDSYRKHFGTIINSESLQYIALDKAIAIVKQILKTDGRWIVADYFRTGQSMEKSGHLWDEFHTKIKAAGFNIFHEQEITQNIYPTLAYVHMWGEKLGLPLLEYLVGKFKQKHPRLHYIFNDVLLELHSYLDKKLDLVNPEIFIRDKKYMLITLQLTA